MSFEARLGVLFLGAQARCKATSLQLRCRRDVAAPGPDDLRQGYVASGPCRGVTIVPQWPQSVFVTKPSCHCPVSGPGFALLTFVSEAEPPLVKQIH